MFGSKVEREYKDVIREVREGRRREPKHRPPHSVEADGTTLLGDEHRRLWEDFRFFGAEFDRLLQHGHWSIEEQPKVEIGWDSPDYGRTYHVYYNGYVAGELEIGLARLLHHPSGRGAYADLDIDALQLIPYSDVRELIWTLSILFQPLQEGDGMRALADADVTKYLTAHLWEVMRSPSEMHHFAYRTEGPYEHFLEIVGVTACG
jgi:hypothetical protein